MGESGAQYIPRADGAFDAWAQNYAAQLHAWWEAHGLDVNDLKPLEHALAQWNAAYPAHVTAQAAAAAASEEKLDARGVLEAVARPLTRFVQSYPSTTDADRAVIGITVPRATRTPSATPATRPRATLTGVNRLAHELLVVDEATPTRRARPRGAARAEVYLTLVGPGTPTPTDPALFRYLDATTRPTFRATFAAQDGGKTAVYMLRWVSTRGGKGPWSDPVTATVAA